MGFSLKKIGQRISQVYDQANVFDNGRTYQNRTPTNTRSVVGQLSHNGATNVVGNNFVKPAIRVPINVGTAIANAAPIGVGHLTPTQIQPVSGISKFTGANGSLSQTAGDILTTGTNLAFPGSSSIVKNAFRAVAPKIVPDIALRATANAGVGAVGGAVNNVGTGLSNNQIHSFNDAKNQALTGAKFGAVLGAGGTLAYPLVKTGGKVALKGGQQGAQKVASTMDTPAVQSLKTTREASLKEFHAAKSPKVAQSHLDNINSIDQQIKDLQNKGGGQPFDNRVGRALTGEKPVTQKEAPIGVPVQEAKKGLAMEVKRAMSDKDQVILDELKSIEKQTGQKGLVNKFMYNSNLQRGSNAIANNALENSANLKNAIGGLSKKDYKSFSDYANARTELSTAGPKTHTSQVQAALKSLIDSGHENYGARFEALNAHYKDLATEARKAGLIDQPTFDRYVANNDYVRLQRDMGDLVPSSVGGRGNSFSLGRTVLSQKRKGSSRATLPVGETAADYTQKVFGEITRNKTATQLVDTLHANGLAEKLDTASAAKNQNHLKVLRDGKTEYYKVSPEIKQAADNINPYHMNAVMQILAAPGRVLRAGVTGLNPVFIARNLIKDQAGSAINSEHLLATHNPVSFFSGLKNSIQGSVGANHDPLWQDFLRHYGDQTSYDLTRNIKDTNTLVNEIRGGTPAKLIRSVKSPIRTLENVAQVTEKSTRFQNFRGEYKKALAQGLSKEQASEKAAIAAWQNSVDFSRAGTWGRVINTVIPYWNPATQGVRQMGRTVAKHPVKSPLTGATILGVPIATATAWNLSNPDTKSTYDKIPEYEKDNNLVLVEPGKNGGYIKIPLPPGYKDVFMPIRRSLEAYHHDKPLQGKQIAQDILQATTGPIATQTKNQFVGSVTPQAIKPFVQQGINKDLYTGKQIIPDYINNATDANGNPISEAKKAYKNSSGTAKIIGNRTDTSPIRLEKLVKDATGTVGQNVLNAVDTQLARTGKIPKDNIGGQSIRTGFKRSFTGNVQEFEKSAGAKYYDNIKKVTSGLTGNEQAAFNALHPAKKNFLGDTIYTADKVYDPASRLDTYNRYPKVFEADKKLDSQSKIHNPLFSLESWQVKKVLEKDNLPPGAKDPELSKLYDQPWYADYATAKSKYFTDSKAAAEKAGKKFGSNDNPYPVTPDSLQKIMDTYSSLPKGTGARSAWIKANPGQWTSMQNQFAKIDDWQNVQRGKRGLDATEGTTGVASGYGDSSKTYSNSGGKSSDPTLNASKYAVSLKAGGSAPKSINVAKVSKNLKYKVALKSTPAKITVRKSRV